MTVTKKIHDWDIVLVHGTVRLIGYVDGDEPHKVKLTSPLANLLGDPLHESAYSGDQTTGQARPLLEAKEGSCIRTTSGKIYQLRGERKEHDGYSSGSIWNVYTKEESRQRSFWSRLFKESK